MERKSQAIPTGVPGLLEGPFLKQNKVDGPQGMSSVVYMYSCTHMNMHNKPKLSFKKIILCPTGATAHPSPPRLFHAGKGSSGSSTGQSSGSS